MRSTVRAAFADPDWMVFVCCLLTVPLLWLVGN